VTIREFARIYKALQYFREHRAYDKETVDQCIQIVIEVATEMHEEETEKQSEAA
jgi:pyrroloquinoline quinone (PQQ) biosynthesis protein C